MSQLSKLEGNPVTCAYGWVLFVLNVIMTAYVFSLEVLPSPFPRQLAEFYHVQTSIVIYVLSCYYYALVIFQIPAGLLLDKYRNNFLIPCSLLLIGLGMVLFSNSYALSTAGIARFIIGIGGSFIFIHGIKCIADWFPARKFAPYFGIFIASELLLTFIFSFLLGNMSKSLGWRKTSFIFGLSGIVLAFLAFIVMKRFKQRYNLYFPERQHKLKSSLHKLFDSSQMWVIGVTVGICIGVFYDFLGRWAIPIFTLAYKSSLTQAFLLLIVGNIGYACGALVFTYISTLIRRRKIFIPWSIALAIIMVIIIVYPPYLGISWSGICFFILGFSIASLNLGYVIIHEQNAPWITATAIASINMFYALITSIADTVIAVFLRLETTLRGIKEYSLYDFETALSRIPLYFLIAFLLSFFIRDTRAKQHDNPVLKDR